MSSGRVLTSRGLDLNVLDVVTEDERAAFAEFYNNTLGHRHIGLEFLLEHDVATMKLYRHYCDVATPRNYEESRRVFVFGFLPFYAVNGYDIGIRYLVHIRQRMGLSKEQILEGVAISGLVCGPRGFETIARALQDYEWIVPETPAQFPEGWSADRGALLSGADFSRTAANSDDIDAIITWYERTIGEVPGYVLFMATVHPDLLKAYRFRFENVVKVVPKQLVPTTLLHFSLTQGSAAAVRENLLLAREFGVSKEIALKVISSASLQGVAATFSLVADNADVFEGWD